MEKVGRKDRPELLPRLVKQVLDITNGIRFPLDANSDENRILEYMDLMEAVAQVQREIFCITIVIESTNMHPALEASELGNVAEPKP